MKKDELKQKEEHITLEGEITKHLKGIQFMVKTDGDPGHEAMCYLSGKLGKHKIKLTPGDRVTVKLSPYDLKKGIIVFRKQ